MKTIYEGGTVKMCSTRVAAIVEGTSEKFWDVNPDQVRVERGWERGERIRGSFSPPRRSR